MPEPLEFEHYEVLRAPDGSPVELGRGGMGITYKAFDTNLRCNVALKVITSSLLEDRVAAERFLREARAAARLRHRNVASVFHLGRHGSSYYYVMEFVEGETVEALVKRHGSLDCRLALEIAQQVAGALIAAEKQQLIHRDIKPSNLMLVREGDDEIVVKVIDFGLAKSAAQEADSTGTLTLQGFVGTPYFASPEQLEHQQEDIRSDIYSLGATVWYMLTGKPPFVGSVASVIAQHLEKPPPFHSLMILPACVLSVVRRMLEKDRRKRIQTPSQLRAELRSCLEQLRASADVTPLLGSADPRFETITLETTRGLGPMPHAGEILNERYRLIEDLNLANPGRTFSAEDIVANVRAIVCIFQTTPGARAQVEEEANRVRALSHPNVVQVLAVEREARFSFVVCEWLQGITLMDLLRARRALSLPETLMLLQQIAPAVDAAAQAGLTVGLDLHGVRVHFPQGWTEPSADVLLRSPLHEWPNFVVKLDALGKAHELNPAVTSGAGQTMVPREQNRDVIQQVGALTYALLGGKPGHFAPLASAMSEAGNEVIRRCLDPARSFPDALAFYEALSKTVMPGPGASRSPRPSGAGTTAQPRSPSTRIDTPGAFAGIGTPQDRSAAGTSSASPPPRRPSLRKRRLLVLTGLLATGGLLAALSLSFFTTRPGTNTAAEAPVTPAPSKVASSTAESRPAFVAGRPWVNGLGMRFVPVGNIEVAQWQTRVRDFEAFVQATGYDAVGGMSSVLPRDGFKLNTLSWKDPGFPQTPEHPVVGVSWEDANQFCTWLTEKEQGAGLLPSSFRYRLPTDHEWSAAVGLMNERGATPEERNGKIKGAYPWGRTFPPAADTRNYAGSESREGAPENWTVIPDFHDPFPRTGPVSAFSPNQRGLYNAGGNVWEWCADKFNNTLTWRTLRGGSWATWRADDLLSSARRGYAPYLRSDEVGFRCVVAADGEP
ncbi:MAG: SUMF1/EgtB/PvdO family nonheme iron enzyme [Verrucomicrobia bacterium]|nr:SUMF1/EgtB/PvdO family nonheme iron enzyme [Verrucomicrobiota bacterium]